MHEMRCMEALGQWSELNVFSKKVFTELATTVEPERKQKMSIIAARGSWAVGELTFYPVRYFVLHIAEAMSAMCILYSAVCRT